MAAVGRNLMRKSYVALAGVVLGLACNLNAQTAVVGSFNRIAMPIESVAPDSVVQVTAENQGLTLIAREDLPTHGTFWLVGSNGSTLPMPCAPVDQSLPIYAISDTVFVADGTHGMAQLSPHRVGYGTVADVLNIQANAVANLVNQTATTQILRPMMRAMGMDTPMFNSEEDSSDSGFYNDADNYTWDTNQLWLEITNVTPSTTFANLHNATNQGAFMPSGARPTSRRR